MFCMQCGKEINVTAKYCSSCGASQETDKDDLPALEQDSLSDSASMQEGYSVAVETKSLGGNWLLILIVFGIFVVLLITNADKLKLLDKDQQALKEFQQSTEGQVLYNCVGANGSINWEIFKSDKTEPNVRVIEAKLSKRQKKFKIQYFYNLETKVKEIAFMSKDGKSKSKFLGALEFSTFCMWSD